MSLRIFRADNRKEAEDAIKETGADERSLPYMVPKAVSLCVEIRNLNARDSNIIKQEALSKGGDASISMSSYALEGASSKVLLMGSLKSIMETSVKLRAQPVKRLRDLSEELSSSVERYLKPSFFRIGDAEYRHSMVMGILNVTPDSFYDGGVYSDAEKVADRAEEIERDGGEIIDLGGQSTRAGYAEVSLESERDRVIPALRAIIENTSVRVPVSVDTTKVEIAEEALKIGAKVINDQEGLRKDGRDNVRMAHLVKEYGASIVLMHNRETSELMFDVLDSLEESISIAESHGIEPECISTDPGIGFGKNAEQNLEIIRNLEELKALGKTITIGASRKSFIGKVLGMDVGNRLEGSLAVLACSVMNGAGIVRVHDVRESVLTVRMVEAVMGKNLK
jgi:dihydropteroate synthase